MFVQQVHDVQSASDRIHIYDERFEDEVVAVVDADGDVAIYDNMASEPVFMSGRAFLELAQAVRDTLVEDSIEWDEAEFVLA